MFLLVCIHVGVARHTVASLFGALRSSCSAICSKVRACHSLLLLLLLLLLLVVSVFHVYAPVIIIEFA
jgi:hypothetical protein